ncbi:hypothetical protein KQJ29_31435, partial [Enterococcus sp. S181_ASV_20]|nr:hypothetical protein [Enterococcus sp. S181_ASV_20]
PRSTQPTSSAASDVYKRQFETQTIWQDFELEAVAEYAEKTLRFNQQANQILQSEIRNEAEQANIKFVPTIVLGEHISVSYTHLTLPTKL